MAEKSKNLIKKQPVVVLVGHIDHGKSSILQKIRDFKITQKETGGITQHIGAYEIEENNKKITFIDTPGHEAFIAMRNRGAKVADIAVLVVAADQGVKPQTKEAISQIKQAGISMIVAINKIDKPDAQIERVKDALVNQGVMVENRGGDIPCIEVSAKTGKNIPELLELILLVDEMENFQTDSKNEAEGVIIESYLDAKKGPMATLLLESGALKQGDIVGTFSSIGKIKRMEDVQKKQIQKIEAGQAVLILGFEKAPIMGERFKVFADIEQARKNLQIKEIKFDIAPEIESSKKNLNLIIKTDVLGSIEPIKNILATIPQEKVVLKVLQAEAGNVNLSDIKLAEASKAIILGFRVKIPNSTAETARLKNIKILKFDLIYDLVEGLRVFMQKTLTSEIIRVDLGKLKALLVFRTEKRRQIIGARILQGEIRKGVKIEIFRDGEEEDNKVGDGKVISLEKNKKEIGKGEKGEEVGVLYEGDTKVEQGDILKVYEKTRQKIEL
ncbi:MAG: translation initiation factor IF-2 [Candidatus Pacebacteria bacterium]|nr:translation initiation factor IF-2 [Candidatus Paceibacterota bacterium]